MRTEYKITIIVAIIGLAGVLGAAIIGIIPNIIDGTDDKHTKVGKDRVKMSLIPGGKIKGLEQDAFYMDESDVTQAAYKNFMDATGTSAPKYWSDPDFDPKQPVVGVTKEDANAYAKWADERLPNEDEWEYAASTNSTKRSKKLALKLYPWGNYEGLTAFYQYHRGKYVDFLFSSNDPGSPWIKQSDDPVFCAVPPENSGPLGFRCVQDVNP